MVGVRFWLMGNKPELTSTPLALAELSQNITKIGEHFAKPFDPGLFNLRSLYMYIVRLKFSVTTDRESECQIRRSVLRSNRLVRPQGFEPRTF